MNHHFSTDWSDYRRTVAPTDHIMTVEEAKKHLHIDHSDDDDYIEGLITVAEAFIEGPSGIGLALNEQTWELSMNELPHNFRLHIGPASSIVSITVDGLALDSSSYRLVNDEVRGTYQPRFCADVVVAFKAGFVTVPADLVHAAKLLIGHYYTFREAAVAGGTSNEVLSIPLGVEAILNRYKRY